MSQLQNNTYICLRKATKIRFQSYHKCLKTNLINKLSYIFSFNMTCKSIDYESNETK